MAQDGPHDHQDTAASGERSLTLPMTMTSTLIPAENNYGGSGSGRPVGMDARKGKDIMPNAIQGGELGSPSSGKGNADKSKGKGPATSNAAADTAGNIIFPNGKNALPADGPEIKAHILTERERRRRMKEMFTSLHALMPHIPKKVDKATLVGETIHYIRALEQTKLELEKRKQEQALARQAAAVAAASSMLAPRTAQGMAAMSDGWAPMPQQQQQQQQQQPPLVAATEPPPPLVADMGPNEFQTWSAPNVVLSVLNDKAVINMCLPRQPRLLTLVASVLNKHKIDVISAQFSADGDRSLFTLYTRVTAAGGENPSIEDIYKLALSEIMVWISG